MGTGSWWGNYAHCARHFRATTAGILMLGRIRRRQTRSRVRNHVAVCAVFAGEQLFLQASVCDDGKLTCQRRMRKVRMAFCVPRVPVVTDKFDSFCSFCIMGNGLIRINIYSHSYGVVGFTHNGKVHCIN